MGEQKAVIKDTDMPEEMQQQAVQCAVLAIEKYSVEREIAALIKRVNSCDILFDLLTSEVGWVALSFLEKPVLWGQAQWALGCFPSVPFCHPYTHLTWHVYLSRSFPFCFAVPLVLNCWPVPVPGSW